MSSFGSFVLVILTTSCADEPTGEDARPTETGSTPTRCPDGFSGEDCAFCTWSSAREACHPGQTADLFDLDGIKALSLDDLGWAETDRYETDGGTLIVGDIVTPFAGVDADGNDADVDMRSQVGVYLPGTFPAETPVDAQGKAFVAATHYAENVFDDVAAAIAVATGMPVLYHGEYTDNWTQLGFDSKADLYGNSWAAVASRNLCEPTDFARGNHQLYMAEVDLRVITLAQRLAEEVGGDLDQFALRGFSKEGAAAWLALATDDRIVVGSAGGYPAQDKLAYAENVVEALGCDDDENTGASGEGSTRSLEWFTTTPAGAAYLNRFDSSLNLDQLRPRVILIDGDVFAGDMHDGTYFIPGAEDEFLDVLDTPWRYVRKGESYEGADGEDGDSVSTTVVPYLIAELLYREDDPSEWYPKVTAAEATISGGVLSVYAEAEGGAEAMSLVGSASADRIWNENGQMDWFAVDLSPSGAGWAGEVDLAALGVEDMVIGWYVEARNTLASGENDYARTDASPIRFLQLTDALTCELEPEDYCEQG